MTAWVLGPGAPGSEFGFSGDGAVNSVADGGLTVWWIGGLVD